MSKLNDAIKELAKKGITIAGDAANSLNIERFSTGLLSLDYILKGGLPKGRIIEIYGFESSGKSSICLCMIAQVQREGKTACLVDLENSYDMSWAKKMGVDTDKLLPFQPNSGEDGLTVIEKLAQTGEVDLIVVDSLAALLPQAEIDGDIGDHTIGLQARLLSKALRKISPIAAKNNCTIIFINQLRYKIGVSFGEQTTTPGGTALKFYSSIRLNVFKHTKLYDTNKIPVGHKITVEVKKSKVSPPFLKTDFSMYFASGIDLGSDILEAGLLTGVIRKDGNSYYYGDTKLGVGFSAAASEIASDAIVAEELHKEIKKIISENNEPNTLKQEKTKKKK